ncbi:cytoplasmic phosphatidylinositol transfer protein 1 isoform X2 [Piliocolobus tephrosceles]|uniref:cytoplasmic phosphatidylinositol transfer protein 1 isoform X2 n=1 Tax=Piliocolobus tephrosceles TaxID=591936 RepID=UPI000C29FD97|nr:cytoplasmic phosphatidylinositol transfer protein 1 isoform X2 [Piliocolobus tephrosceles]
MCEQYKIGQLYMISKHSHEQSDRGEGVEVVQNEPFEDPHHGNGQFTEKRVYLNSKLPSWARAVVPKIFYVTEKAWNYYPYTITEYTCSFLPKFSIHIETKYEDNKGSNDRIFDNEAKDLEREVCFIDIACDEIPERYYKESEDPKHFKSEKTGRGQLREGWRDNHQPIMCSYKLVTVKFEVWGLQTRVEQFVHKVVRDILLIGHRQAFAWVDEWYDMTMDDVREYEKNMHEQTNIKVCNQHSSPVDDIESHAQTSVRRIFKTCCPPFHKCTCKLILEILQVPGSQPSIETCRHPEPVAAEPELDLNWAVSPLSSRHFDPLKLLDVEVISVIKPRTWRVETFLWD